jgi:AhpD family alkylhydroperoxidase
MAGENVTRTKTWFEELAPEMAGQWREFHDSVYDTGQLDRKTKELVAAASGAIMRCRYCTKGHIQKAQREEATKEEVAEALMIAALMGSGTQLYWMRDDYEELLGRDGKAPAPWFQELAEEMGTSWRTFHEEIYEDSVLDRRTKELIAAVCGTLLRCRHCTRGHIQKAKKYGASEREITEALMVGSLIASGSQLAWMKDDYEELLG